MKVTDATGYSFDLPSPPMRIASWVPSQTEYLIDLGLEDRLIGVTKFCIHPSGLRTRENQIGGTKNIWRDRLLELRPDLVIANKEENTREDVEWSRDRFPTYTTDITDIPSALEMMNDLALLCGVHQEGKEWTRRILEGFSLQKERAVRNPKPMTCLYLIWKDPFMAAGKGNFIGSVLEHAGLQNLIEDTRYPEISIDDINRLQPEVIFLSSEPFPFSEKHLEDLHNCLEYSATLKIVDGEMFSWYGSRLIKTPIYLEKLLGSLDPW